MNEARIYTHMRMYNLENEHRQLRVYQRKSNNYILASLGMKTLQIRQDVSRNHVIKQIRAETNISYKRCQGQIAFF